MPQGEPISHAEMIAAVKQTIRFIDKGTVIPRGPSTYLTTMLAVLAHLERTQPIDSQADLTERARAEALLSGLLHYGRGVPAWLQKTGPDYELDVARVRATLQSEREASAAEARKIIQDLVENFGAGGPKANKAFAVATRFLLASPSPETPR